MYRIKLNIIVFRMVIYYLMFKLKVCFLMFYSYIIFILWIKWELKSNKRDWVDNRYLILVSFKVRFDRDIFYFLKEVYIFI